MSRDADAINRRTMMAPAVVQGYARRDELWPSERAALEPVRDEVRGRAILDIGVGGGRTVPALSELSEHYVGIDYSPAMVDACRRRFPAVRLEHGDARDLSAFRDHHFHLVVFSCNGLGMLSHDDRLRTLAEIHRVLAPGGAFLFSTHNRNSPEHDAGFRLPPIEAMRNPLRFVTRVVTRVRNRRRHVPLEIRTPTYSIINDVCHDYGTLLYYIDLAQQRLQLEAAGFRSDVAVYDLDGRRVEHDTDHNSITLLARK